MGKQKTIHILSNTHWDREWRFPFQETRINLIKLLDYLIELMEKDPEYKYFNFDSQSIFLEDYLEFRPQNEARLKKLISDGRIIVGPWYTLPEEFSVSGESLIRNLLMGRRMGQAFGKTSGVGYTPTSYGQISQLPQIYQGFGIDGMMFYRGIHHSECTNEYFWEGADGSRILGIRLSRHVSRGAFFIYVSHRTMHDSDWMGYRWGEEGVLSFHLNRADFDHEEEPVLIRSPYGKTFKPEIIETGIKQAMDDILSQATTDCLVLFDGMDSTYPNKNLPEILKQANAVNPDWRFMHSSLPLFLEDLKSQIDPDKLTVLKGERRHPSPDNMFNAFLKDALSSRMYIKQRNAEAERALLQWAEPFSCIVQNLTGVEYPERELVKAWKYLLSNHPHDSIGGLSPDQIHKDMMYRFDQAQIIADTLTKEALGEIIAKIDTSDADPGDVLITVFNPSPFERDEIPVVFVDLPREAEYRSFTIFDDAGNKAAQQIISREDSYLIATERHETPMTFYTTKWKIAFAAQQIPALGFKTFTLKPQDGTKSNHGSQTPAPLAMENEYLSVIINEDGTLSIFDKESGQHFNRLLYFEDSGEAGDPWMHIKPFANRIAYSIGQICRTELLDDGPLLTRYRISMNWKLPAEIDQKSKQRSAFEKEMPLSCQITLKKGDPKLYVEIDVDNTIKDHRLRVLFDAGFKAKSTFVHGQFDLLERTVQLPDTSDWLEPVTGTNPQYGTVYVHNDQRGLAVHSLGLTEYEILDNDAGSIALTLLRAYGYPKMSGLGKEDRVVRHGNEGSQCPEKQHYSLALSFSGDAVDQGNILKNESCFKYPPLTVQHSRYAGEGISKSGSFFKIEPRALLLSALKKSEHSGQTVLRLYNPTTEKLSGRLWTRFTIKSAALFNLDESEKEKIKTEGEHTIELEVLPKKILTIGLDLS